VALRPRLSPGLPLSVVRCRFSYRRVSRSSVLRFYRTPRGPTLSPSVPPGAPQQKTPAAWVSPLSRFRDLLPSRPGRAARQRASRFVASELCSNMLRASSSARPVARVRRSEQLEYACVSESTNWEGSGEWPRRSAEPAIIELPAGRWEPIRCTSRGIDGEYQDSGLDRAGR
jgi:hypothetical protein